MKKFLKKFGIWTLIAVFTAALIPSVAKRAVNEKNNNRIVVSVLYNDLRNKVSKVKTKETMEEYKKLGVNTVSVMEDDINSMVARGEITCIKYNVLKHKYDDESIALADIIRDNYPQVANDSHLFITKDEKTKEKLGHFLPLKYSSDEYVKIEGTGSVAVYAFLNGRTKLWNITLGYDTEQIESLKNAGFDIALIYKVKNYSKQGYVKEIEKIVEDYDVRYINLKTDSVEYDEDEIIDGNYTWIGKMINRNDMTLVVTENSDQLSNQKCLGYSRIFNDVMGDGGSKKVIRAYETYDDSQSDETNYEYRVNQYFNSSIDRNIRFITVTMIAVDGIDYNECADYTLKAVEGYMAKAEKCGFVFDSEPSAFDYGTSVRLPSACCAVIMILLVLKAFYMLTKIKSRKLELFALALSVIAFGITFVLPVKLVLLYPTVYCLVISCFAMTLVTELAVKLKKKYNTVTEIFIIAAIMLAVLCIGALGMGAMLSGIDYYINNYIFRGIKLSLMIPLIYTAATFYFAVCLKDEKSKPYEALIKVLKSDIKVYWVIIGGVIGIIGMYYIVRSGNVNSISSIEQAMRTAITNIFPARPRTKEFLIGYPSLVLFMYYMRNSNIKLIQWFFAVGTSILSASVMNSFCHVFTDLSIIYQRVANGVIIGAVVSIIVLVANAALVRIIKKIAPDINNIGLEME